MVRCQSTHIAYGCKNHLRRASLQLQRPPRCPNTPIAQPGAASCCGARNKTCWQAGVWPARQQECCVRFLLQENPTASRRKKSTPRGTIKAEAPQLPRYTASVSTQGTGVEVAMPWEGAGEVGKLNSMRGTPSAHLPSTLDTSGASQGNPPAALPHCPLFPPRAHSFLDVGFACSVQVIHNFL